MWQAHVRRESTQLGRAHPPGGQERARVGPVLNVNGTVVRVTDGAGRTRVTRGESEATRDNSDFEAPDERMVMPTSG